MISLVNYANFVFRHQQLVNSRTGLETAGFDQVFSYAPADIDPVFVAQNRHILHQQRGDGYWLWKPYFILKTLKLLDTGDFLFYCDSGAYFIQSILPIVDISRRTDQDIIPFELIFLDRGWTKRDAYVLMECDEPRFAMTRQRLASYSLWKKSSFTMDFLEHYLAFAQDERILTDIENQCGQPNHPGFKQHRHDQSIFSLLSKKFDLQAYRDPSQFGIGPKQLERHPTSTYGQLIEHVRRDNVAFTRKAWIKLRLLFEHYVLSR